MVAEFAVEVFQNEYLTDGARDVDAIVTVTATGTPATGVESADVAQVLIVDCSGSMRYPPAKLAAAKHATVTAIDALRDGVAFAVVEGTETARMIYP
ncbi:MAG: VWA domain-containing protein, partial [Umezawaea sp.]